MTLPWYARDHQKALDGMMVLTLEERGAYNTVLDLIYSRSGPVPDDERWLAGWMGCSVKKWRLLRAALLVKNKLYASELPDGQSALMNERARLELDSAMSRRRAAGESGSKGGRKSAETRANINKNNDDDQATLEGSLPGSLKLITETDTGTESPVEPIGSPPPQRSEAKGSRLPDDWRPDSGGWVYAAEQLGPNVDPARELDRFRDYWRAVPGAKGRKADWPATWRNWVRRAAENLPRKAHERPHADAKFASRQANHAAALRGAERAAGQRWEP
jgi:uncharacterized protein YdaU (DUF1376 family)